jgi:hypothetical protein
MKYLFVILQKVSKPMFARRGSNFVHAGYTHLFCLVDDAPLLCVELLFLHVKSHLTMHINPSG